MQPQGFGPQPDGVPVDAGSIVLDDDTIDVAVTLRREAALHATRIPELEALRLGLAAVVDGVPDGMHESRAEFGAVGRRKMVEMGVPRYA